MTRPRAAPELVEDTVRDLSGLRRAVQRWAGQHGRDLPWRDIRDPYRVWISEIMLQQTTVAAVKPYYERFLTHFPDVFALAAADEADVLRLWEGLGYYSRARNLHRGARQLVTQWQGVFPQDVVALQTVPGIGRYTAGAIASFAYGMRAPIVEANTLRLYARLLGYEGDPRGAAGQKVLWSFAETILPSTETGRFNQTLMDLGATVCTPQAPACPVCPVRVHCRANREQRVTEIPRPAVRRQMTNVAAYTIAIRAARQFLIRRCQPGERWAGLWDFPRFERETPLTAPVDIERTLSAWSRQTTGLQIQVGPQVAEIRHVVTRYRITLRCFLAERMAGRLARDHEWKWVSTRGLADYPLSVTGRKIANRLRDDLW